MAEGKNTGVPLMLESMEMNGSDHPSFITGDARSYFTVVFPIHSYYLRKGVLMGAESTGASLSGGVRKHRRTRQEIIDEVISIVSERDAVTMKELADLMGYKSTSTSLKAVVSMLVSDGTLDYTMENRTDPRQGLRLGRRSR